MKELSIEEKAKAYDNVRKKIATKFGSNVTKEIFSEYEESEDDRTRKEIISAIKEDWPGHADWIAWLEKQGEHANFRNKIQVGDKVTRNEDGVLVNLSQLNRIAKPADKQCEQKPAEWTMDNIEELTEFENAMMHIGGSFFGEHQGLDPNDTFVVKEQAKILLEMATKQEWSDGDEKKRKGLIKGLEDRMGFGWASDPFSREEYINWLKSIRPKNRWKPSDEQMEALDDAIDICSKQNNDIGDWLDNLREELKKLKG